MEDVEILIVETLELIQEPDGGPTGDFVLPEGFRQGSRRTSRMAIRLESTFAHHSPGTAFPDTPVPKNFSVSQRPVTREGLAALVDAGSSANRP